MHKGTYIKYLEREDWGFFPEAIEYFRQKLIGHEIFLRIFDGPQKMLLRTFPFF